MKVAVTGGGGFLGRRIVEMLREEDTQVVSIARGHYPELEALGVECRRVDITDCDALCAAFEGIDEPKFGRGRCVLLRLLLVASLDRLRACSHQHMVRIARLDRVERLLRAAPILL